MDYHFELDTADHGLGLHGSEDGQHIDTSVPITATDGFGRTNETVVRRDVAAERMLTHEILVDNADSSLWCRRLRIVTEGMDRPIWMVVEPAIADLSSLQTACAELGIQIVNFEKLGTIAPNLLDLVATFLEMRLGDDPPDSGITFDLSDELGNLWSYPADVLTLVETVFGDADGEGIGA